MNHHVHITPNLSFIELCHLPSRKLCRHWLEWQFCPICKSLELACSYVSSIKNANAQNLVQLKRVFEVDHIKIRGRINHV